MDATVLKQTGWEWAIAILADAGAVREIEGVFVVNSREALPLAYALATKRWRENSHGWTHEQAMDAIEYAYLDARVSVEPTDGPRFASGRSL